MDGQCKCGLEGEGIVFVGGGDTKPGCVKETGQRHQHPHRSGKICGGRRKHATKLVHSENVNFLR